MTSSESLRILQNEAEHVPALLVDRRQGAVDRKENAIEEREVCRGEAGDFSGSYSNDNIIIIIIIIIMRPALMQGT